MPSVERDWAIVRGVNAKQAIAIKPLAIVLRMRVWPVGFTVFATYRMESRVKRALRKPATATPIATAANANGK
jgi:hypothetical protein